MVKNTHLLFPIFVLAALLPGVMSCDTTTEEQQPAPIAEILPVPEVEVVKAVFRIHVGPGYVANSYKHWIFISDADGRPSEARPIINDSVMTIEFPKPHQEGQTYSINMLRHYDVAPGQVPAKRYVLETYTGLFPGDYNLLAQVNAPQTGTPSSHYVRIVNLPDTPRSYAGIYGKKLGGYQITLGHNFIEYQAQFYGAKEELNYYVAFDGECRYVKIPDAQPGEHVVVSYDTMAVMENSVTYKFDNPVKASAATYGLDDDDDRYTQLTDTWSSRITLADQLKFYYPADHYDNYHTQLTIYNNDMTQSHQYIKHGPTIPTAFKMWPGRITQSEVADSVLTTSLTHTATVLHVNSQSTMVDGNNPARCIWSIFMPGKLTQSIKLPKLPESLATQHPAWAEQALNFKNGTVTELSGSATYHDYIKILLQPSTPRSTTEFPYPDGELIMYTQLVDSE